MSSKINIPIEGLFLIVLEDLVRSRIDSNAARYHIDRAPPCGKNIWSQDEALAGGRVAEYLLRAAVDAYEIIQKAPA
jgi:hypothetical protein